MIIRNRLVIMKYNHKPDEKKNLSSPLKFSIPWCYDVRRISREPQLGTHDAERHHLSDTCTSNHSTFSAWIIKHKTRRKALNLREKSVTTASIKTACKSDNFSRYRSSYSLHTEKSFLNLIQSNWNQIVFTILRLIWNSKRTRLI